jgi:hypothetical protein
VAELVPQLELLPKTDESVVALPRELPILTLPRESTFSPETAVLHETANDVSAAGVLSAREMNGADDDGEPDLRQVAIAEPAQPVVVQMLSHHERRALRKIAHLEKKKERAIKHSQALVCR